LKSFGARWYKLYGFEYLPDWFLVAVAIAVAVFMIASYLVSRGGVDYTDRESDNISTKVFYYENPLHVMTRPVEVLDVKLNCAGQVCKQFNNMIERFLSLFLRNYFVHIKGTDHLDNSVEIKKEKGKNGLFKSRWKVNLLSSIEKEEFFITGKRKDPNGVIADFTYKGQLIKIKKQYGEPGRGYHFYMNEGEVAKVTFAGKVPPRKVFIDGGEGEIPTILLATIVEAIKIYR
jgi:hypothetical protein